MSRRYHIKCIECGKSGVFADEHDIRQSKWKVIAWDVKSGEPKCTCETCEYNGIKVKK